MSNYAIVIVGDNNYIDKNYAITCIKSFIYNNKWFDGDIVFFEDDVYNKISIANKERLKLYYDKIVYKKIDCFGKYTWLFNNSMNQIFEVKYLHAYPKFEIFNLEEYDKVLCIDADIIINDNLQELFNQNIALGVTSSLRYFYADAPISYDNEEFRRSLYWVADSGGFNSGMMYYGNKTFLNKQIYNEFIHFIKTSYSNIFLGCFDQDLLNSFFYNKYKDKVVWLSPIYNVSIYRYSNEEDHIVHNINMKYEMNFTEPTQNEKFNELIDNAKIIHYLYKYEQLSRESKGAQIYEKYLRLSNNILANRIQNINLSNFNIGLVIIADNNYIDNEYTITCIKSFLFNNRWFRGDIIFFYDDQFCTISLENQEKLKSLYESIKFIHIDYNKYNDIIHSDLFINYDDHLNRIQKAYPKFELFNLKDYDKILCLDADILVIGDLKELFIKDISLGVANSLIFNEEDISYYDYKEHNFKKYNEHLELNSGGFNSGVMYFGNKSLLNDEIYNDFMTYLYNEINNRDKNKQYLFFDQCILSYFFNETKYNNYITVINPIYNMQFGYYNYYSNITDKYCVDKMYDVIQNTKILHFTLKPEQCIKGDIVVDLYNYYKNLPTYLIESYKHFGESFLINLKVAVCVACKNENNYIREFIWHYKNLGFDHIFIIDNNDDEYMDNILYDYIQMKYITIINWRGQRGFQNEAYTKVYKEYGNDYDWIAYFDCDELLEIKNGSKNIQEFLLQKKFNEYSLINVFWVNYGDENLITVKDDNYSMKDRFKTPIITHTIEDYQPKSIIRTKLPIIEIEEAHVGNTDECIKRCNVDGNPITTYLSGGSRCLPISIKSAQLNHYRTKTLEEYVKTRYTRNYAFDKTNNRCKNIHFFFIFNEQTKEKEHWLKDNYPNIYQQLMEPWDLAWTYDDVFTNEQIYGDWKPQ